MKLRKVVDKLFTDTPKFTTFSLNSEYSRNVLG